jgi:DNA-binding PadR family transcriptional regulator
MPYSTVQFTQELKRGTFTLAVLKMLETRHYGYSLKKSLLERNFEIEESTLYPMLRRLEKQGFISSTWEIEENRPRKYYQLNNEGKKLLNGLTKEYNHLSHAVKNILK